MKNIKVSFIINIIIFVLTVFASIIMFSGFKFMQGPDLVLQSSSVGMFRFFTVDSNMFMGIMALIYAIYEFKVIKGTKKDIGKRVRLLKYMATVSVSLTFIVVFSYLGPITKGGIILLLKNSNLFFHLIIPVLSIINMVLFERSNKLQFKDTIYGILPTVLYAIYYMTNVLIHMESGKVVPDYDWYYFVQNGVWTAAIVIPIMLLITFIIALVLWRLSFKKEK